MTDLLTRRKRHEETFGRERDVHDAHTSHENYNKLKSYKIKEID